METTKLIENYLDNTLNEEDRHSVETRAAEDQSFKELLELHQEVNESIRDHELITLQRKLTDIGNEFTGVTVKTFNRKMFLRIAASLLILVGSIAIIKLAFHKPVEDKIFNKYYQPYGSDAISRGNIGTDQLIVGIENYASGKYKVCFRIFDDLTQSNPENYIAWFYRGLAAIEIRNFSEAVRSFQSIPESWNHLYGEHRDWYLALALLKQGNVKGATEMMVKISNSQGFYAGKAKEIVIKLSS